MFQMPTQWTEKNHWSKVESGRRIQQEDPDKRRRVEILNEDPKMKTKIKKKEAKGGRPKNFLFGECGGVCA